MVPCIWCGKAKSSSAGNWLGDQYQLLGRNLSAAASRGASPKQRILGVSLEQEWAKNFGAELRRERARRGSSPQALGRPPLRSGRPRVWGELRRKSCREQQKKGDIFS